MRPISIIFTCLLFLGTVKVSAQSMVEKWDSLSKVILKTQVKKKHHEIFKSILVQRELNSIKKQIKENPGDYVFITEYYNPHDSFGSYKLEFFNDTDKRAFKIYFGDSLRNQGVPYPYNYGRKNIRFEDEELLKRKCERIIFLSNIRNTFITPFK